MSAPPAPLPTGAFCSRPNPDGAPPVKGWRRARRWPIGAPSPAPQRRLDLAAALAGAERAARAGWRHRLSHPLRQLRPWLHRWAGPVEVECRLFTGQRLRAVLPEIVGTELYRRGYIEASLTRVLLEHLGPGMVFVDVGAHYGYHALVASALVGPSGTVVAFEPGRAAWPLLQRNVAGVGNVRIERLALSSRSGTTELRDFGLRHSALNTLLPSARVPPAQRRELRAITYPVTCTTLDEHLDAAGLVPDLVKLDVEGAERAVLEGMRRLLTTGSPLVALETGDYDGMDSPSTGASIELLEDLGYECLEYADGLRPHRRRARYGYDNLYFRRRRPPASRRPAP